MRRTKFPLVLNKAQNFPNFYSDIFIREPIQTIDRIQLSVDSRCFSACLSLFKEEFGYRGQYSNDIGRTWEFYFDRCQIQLIKYLSKEPNRQMWFSIRLQDPSKLVQQKVREFLMMILDSLGLDHERVSVTQVEFALDFIPSSPEFLLDLANCLQSSLTMRHARMSSCWVKETTMYIGKKGNVRNGTKGVRCYLKEGNRVRVELQANKEFLKTKKIAIGNLPISNNFAKVFDHIRFYYPISRRELEKIITRTCPNLKNSRNTLGLRVLGAILRKGPVVQQMDTIRCFLEKHGRKYDKGRLFKEWEIQL